MFAARTEAQKHRLASNYSGELQWGCIWIAAPYGWSSKNTSFSSRSLSKQRLELFPQQPGSLICNRAESRWLKVTIAPATLAVVSAVEHRTVVRHAFNLVQLSPSVAEQAHGKVPRHDPITRHWYLFVLHTFSCRNSRHGFIYAGEPYPALHRVLDRQHY
jgi:hypothetical protein